MSDRVLVVEQPGHPTIREVPSGGGGLRVETVFSGLSAGTELAAVKGTTPFATSAWDSELGLFRPGSGAGYPIERLGYMEVGRVAETGALVAMAYGHRTGYEADPLVDRIVPLPPDLDPILGVYVAHAGPICANGLLHAAADLYGEARTLGDGVRGRRVVTLGAGMIGLLTALLARHHGAASVVVVDPTPARRSVAERLGFETLDPDAVDVAVTLKTRWRHAAADHGADVVFQCRGRAEALALALRVLRPQGSVIDLAFYQGGAEAVRLGEEFHHNGLTVRCAQIGRVPRGTAHAWDRDRLSVETVDLLRAEGAAIREHLITDLVPFDDAPAHLRALATRDRSTVQTVFTFTP
ncbi:zinc-binding alcohol dehydrogenase [Cryptosporangium japonicum]|uniref:Alcohol dehydrogenase-like C-terminal domain-containing protein n=1 Tax=Cryptosporangium japonicum TaxID=80872 RepID=A0ABN0TWB2_9ACTN